MKTQQKPIQQELSDITTPELKQQVAVADALSQTPRLGRSRLAIRSGWALLQSRARESGRLIRYHRRRVAVVVALLALLCMGAVALSLSSLPGDALYAVKRRVEDVQVKIALTNAKRADACSVIMKRRANELALLSGSTLQTSTIRSLNQSIQQKAEEFEAYADKSGSKSIRLEQQRARDAKYVIEALHAAQKHANSADQRAAIQQTQDAMKRIVDQRSETSN